MNTRIQFMEELNHVRRDILAMGVKVEDQLAKALFALTSQDVTLAKEVKAQDALVDALQLTIEDEVSILIATQQPVARDLRELVAVFKVTDNLERAGDHAVHLAKAAIKLAGEPQFAQIQRLTAMAETGRVMVRGAVDAFIAHDIDKAREVAAMDDIIDAEHKSLVDETLELMRSDPSTIKGAARLITTSGYLERLGDHMTNLCEAVIFMVEGRHVELNE